MFAYQLLSHNRQKESGREGNQGARLVEIKVCMANLSDCNTTPHSGTHMVAAAYHLRSTHKNETDATYDERCHAEGFSGKNLRLGTDVISLVISSGHGQRKDIYEAKNRRWHSRDSDYKIEIKAVCMSNLNIFHYSH